MTARRRFDEQYYEQFYFDRRTRVSHQRHVDRIGAYVSSYLKYAEVPVKRVLDAGCGIGLWRKVVAQSFPSARYEGIEVSPWLCSKYGWKQASIADYRSRGSYDLVICQGVLPYLSDAEAAAAIDNLARLCRGALYFEAVTSEDWDSVVDAEVSDPKQHLRPARWYRRRLEARFTHAGCGIWLSPRANCVLFALEHA
jgi:2-polyprenyl-3-methyl-5-hydroxy-6-metoxy-1,4-benzoquinol methylase